MDADWRDAVLAFWFEELTEKDWYAGGDALDQTIRDRFGALHAELGKNVPVETSTDPLTALAAVIVFDQFSRNMFRKTPEAFASDAQALNIARKISDAELDSDMERRRRNFFYLPFMHSEVLADQERAVNYFKQSDNEDGAKYAVEHCDIIARFGRFPHRNNALGRESSPEEIAFLDGHDGYGQ